jgi:hypothetical protein
MSRGRQNINQSDLTKAIKAVAAAGVQAKVEVDADGKISVYVNSTDSCQSQANNDPDPNEWATDDQN